MLNFPAALPLMAMQLVDSSLSTTSEFWRRKVGLEDFAEDPRSLREILADHSNNKQLREFCAQQAMCWPERN